MVAIEFSSRDFPNFQEDFHTLIPEMDITEINLGGRLIPRSLVTASDDSVAALTNTLRFIVDNGSIFAGIGQNVSRLPTSVNSVHPGWA